MGLLDRFAQAIAERVEKSPNIRPQSATPVNASAIQSTSTATYNSTPLFRNDVLASNPFPAAVPLYPQAINPLNPNTNRPDPRRFEFLVAQNINIFENRLIPFKTLRAAADQIDILRRCIEVRKAKLTGLDWDIVLSEAATEKIISESGGNHLQAMAKARDQYADEIARLRSFWETPDPQNGLSFVDWFGMAIEEIDSIDALAIWPQMTVGGDVKGFQILDGSTIKPLIDDRGMRPTPDIGPAFQQILYGFPRSEFVAGIDSEDADGEFSSDELAYLVRNRRAFTIWGQSPVERALPVADIYLRRQQWLKAEFTEGTMPKSWLELPENANLTPEQIRAYENIYNDDLAGMTEQRNKLRFLLPGAKLLFEEGYSEKFSDKLDDYLVTSITGHFGVLPTEIGFSAKSGLGGSGHQQGEAEAAESIGIIPTARWFSEQFSQLSYRWLGMPRELEFRIAPSDRTDNADKAKRDDIEVRNGGMTVNEHRSEKGLPLIESPEADMPILVAGQSVFMFSPEGLIAAGTPVDEDGTPDETQTQPAESAPVSTPAEKPTEKPSEKSAQDEIRSFLRWVRKGNTNRTFNFEQVEQTYAEVLNKFVEANDLDGARWYAERYLGL
jgi:hypothetical protein